MILASKVLTFVAKHERDSQQSVLAASSPLDLWCRTLESIDEQQSQQNYVLCHLSGGQDVVNPFSKLRAWLGQIHQARGKDIWP